MTMKLMWVGALLALLVLVAGRSQAGEEVMKDGVLHVQNGAEPRDGLREVQLQEMWRVGSEDGEDFFGVITQLVVGDDGTIYLLDTRLAEIPVYSPDGERINTLSREGDGPGESRIPVHLLFMPDGSLGLCQRFPGKIIKVDLDNSPMGSVQFGDPTAGGFFILMDVAVQGDNLVVSGEGIDPNEDQTGQTRTSFAGAFDAEGNELFRFEEHSRELDFTSFVWTEDEIRQVDFRKMVVGRDGRVYINSWRNKYEINVYLPDGGLERVITREFEHWPRDQETHDLIEERLTTQLAQLPGAKWHISETEPDIGALRIGPDGNLWVESSRSGRDQPEGVFYTWDVFTPDGHFVEQVAARCPGDGEEDMMLWTKDGAIQVTGFISAVLSLQGGGAAGDEDEEAVPMEIIYYTAAGI